MSGLREDVLVGLREAIDALSELSSDVAAADGGGPQAGRFTSIVEQCAGRLAGSRVLVVGPHGPADVAALAAAGASDVVACEQPSLDAGTFDIVLCDGVLHRVLEPMALLSNLRAVLDPDGLLLLGSMVLADPERSEYLRFVPTGHAGYDSWWFVPGRLALRWMVQTAGFEVEGELGEREGPRDGFPVSSILLRARPAAL
jgi:SAM-dependent methyltransferase